MTYTGEAGPFHGTLGVARPQAGPDRLDPVVGDPALPTGQNAADVRFLVQAVNGVGVVGVDNNLGAYYTPGVAVGLNSLTGAPTTLDPRRVPASVAYGTNADRRRDPDRGAGRQRGHLRHRRPGREFPPS